MALIVDASVALKWVFPEVDSDKAAALTDQSLAAPDFLLLECANAIASKVRRGVLSSDQAEDAWAGLTAVNVRRAPATMPLLIRSRQIASTTKRSAYDCLYLAVALAEGSTLVTADERFFNAMAADRTYAPSLRLL